MNDIQDQIITDIREEIKKTEEKIRELKSKLSIEETVLKRLKRLGKAKHPLLSTSENVSDSQSDTQGGTIIEHIVAVLSENGGSMRIKDITKKLAAQGIKSDAQGGLSQTVANALFRRRNDLFQRLRRGLYRLRSQSKVAG